MSVFQTPVARAFGLALVFAAGVEAQEATECEVNENRPSQIARATLAVQVASNASSEGAARQLKSAVKLLTDNGERMDNQPGRNFVLGKALVIWSMQPNVEMVAQRGLLGYSANAEGTIDLAMAIDSAFKVVEAAHPECVAETSRWRGQKPWVDLVNQAIERLNAEDADSAETAARRAIMLNPFAPYGYVVLANVMQKRQRATEAFELYRKSVEVSAGDTTYAEVRRQSLVYLGSLAADSAEAVDDSVARRPYLDIARSAFTDVLQDKEAGEMASTARAGLCRVAIVTGDTASLRETYSEPLAAAAGFSYNELMNAGVCLARAEMVPEATKIFQAAYEKNPYHRDVLSNLSLMYLQAEQFRQSLPLAQRVVSVEPNNPDNLQLLVLSYAGIARGARDARVGTDRPTPVQTKTKGAAPARRPTAPRLSPAASDSLFAIEKAFTDSAVSTNMRKEKLAYKVTLSEFTISDAKAGITGNVTNQGTEQKAITMKVEFLDRSGAVVSTKEESLGSPAPGSNTRFNVTATPGTSIVAVRYAPIG